MQVMHVCAEVDNMSVDRPTARKHATPMPWELVNGKSKVDAVQGFGAGPTGKRQPDQEWLHSGRACW